MAFRNHVPETVIYVIAVVSLLAAIVVGYAFGMGRLRQFFSIGVLSFAITLVLIVIIDLDKPRTGFIRVSQQPLLDLQQQIRSR